MPIGEVKLGFVEIKRFKISFKEIKMHIEMWVRWGG